MTYCAFCDEAAEFVIVHKAGEDGHSHGFETPVCHHCADVYECGQAHPNARIAPIEED